jgi:hypothetical protein
VVVALRSNFKIARVLRVRTRKKSELRSALTVPELSVSAIHRHAGAVLVVGTVRLVCAAGTIGIIDAVG